MKCSYYQKKKKNRLTKEDEKVIGSAINQFFFDSIYKHLDTTYANDYSNEGVTTRYDSI